MAKRFLEIDQLNLSGQHYELQLVFIKFWNTKSYKLTVYKSDKSVWSFQEKNEKVLSWW
jgi:hypothetical protein